jgi:hypothetical protein
MKKIQIHGGTEPDDDFNDEFEDPDDEDEPIEQPLTYQEYDDELEEVDDWFYVSDIVTAVDFIALQNEVEFSDVNNSKFYNVFKANSNWDVKFKK